VADFLEALVSLRLLERDGAGNGSVYRNTVEAAAFLDEGSPQYIGGFLEMAGARLYHFWRGLRDASRTGSTQNEIKHGETSIVEEL
jgi:hypothetical protein